jgi:hypothetical protein
MVWTRMLLKTTLVSALAGGFMLFGNATIARANSRDSCYRNVQEWEYKLDRDINRHELAARHARTANAVSATPGEAAMTTTATAAEVGVILPSTKTL